MSIGNLVPQYFAYIKVDDQIPPVKLEDGGEHIFTIRTPGRNHWLKIKNETGEILSVDKPKYIWNKRLTSCSLLIDVSTLFFKCGIGLYREDLEKIEDANGSIDCKVVRKENVEEGIKFIP